MCNHKKISIILETISGWDLIIFSIPESGSCTKTTTFFTQTFSIARPLLLTATVYESKLISNLLCEINAIQPFDALGFFVVDLSTFTSIISTALTYLVIITQFYASYDNCPFSSSVMNSTLV